ncbi:hypothetical protein NMG60_11032584 [Bertholletia excelsa]
MGKLEEHQQHLQQQEIHGARSSAINCERCSVGLSTISREFNLKCMFILIFSFCMFLPAVFWVIPLYSTASGFDAKNEIKRAATVQAYFQLQKPVQVLVKHIERLEYDIYGEIGIPNTKVALLSMHQAGASNWTHVVFGILSDPINVSINPVSLSVLRSSLIDLFLQPSNMTLTTIFGEATFFQILQFPGGITVIPGQASIWQVSQSLFNFTLYNSIFEIKEYLVELKEQLKWGLHLRSYENVYVQITNRHGSTRDPPVTVEAAVMSQLGGLLPQRLKQLAQTITGSPPAKNLGLDNSVFGKVKEVSLSSYLNHTLNAKPPTPSPAPAPEQNDNAKPSVAPYHDIPPSYSPAPLPDKDHPLPPCFNCDASSPSNDDYPHPPSPENAPHYYLPPVSSSPAPSKTVAPPPHSNLHCGSTISPSPSPTSNPGPSTHPAISHHGSYSYRPPAGPTPQLSPDLSPSPVVSHGFSPRQEKGNSKDSEPPPLASPSMSPSPSSIAVGPSYKEIWLFSLCGLLTFHLLWWS